jgi:hypothetical protein
LLLSALSWSGQHQEHGRKSASHQNFAPIRTPISRLSCGDTLMP